MTQQALQRDLQVVTRTSITSALASRPTRVMLAGVVFVALLLSASLLVKSDPAAAAGGVGSSGTASGGTGGAQTTKGFGWYQFPVDGSVRPRGMKAGNWDDVLATCRATNASSVIAFTVSEVQNGGPTTSIVYNYPSDWLNIEGWLNYKGNNGGGYVRLADANWAFNSLGSYGVDTSGYTWHSNVAWFCWDIRNAKWTVNPSTQIKKANTSTVYSDSGWGNSNLTAKPGETMYWKHTLTAASDKIDTNVHFEMKGRNFTGFPISNGGDSGAVANGTTFARLGSYPGATNASYTVYTITQNDVGQSAICQHIEWQPYSWDNGGAGSSGERCVSVPYNYSLQPTIDNVDDGTMIESGAGPYAVTGKVQNSGDTKSHTGIQWQVTQLRYAPGVDPVRKAGGDDAAAPCAYFTGSMTCGPRTTGGSGTEAAGYGKDAFKDYATNGVLGDVPVGTKFCFAMSIKRASSTVTDWRHSKLYCLTVGKKPKVQIYGGDLVVGRGYNATNTKISSSIVTSVTNKNSTYYGSWSEYAMIPSGTVTGMASGSGYAGGVTSKDLCGKLSYLTFTNASNATSPTCSSGSIGRYNIATTSQLGAIEARFAVTAGAANQTGGVNVASLAGATVYPGSGSISLSSTGTIGSGKWVVINAPNADVRITSNILYADGPYTSVTDIPQLVIIARNIVIDNDVTQVDAWLLAKGTGANGTITTCDDESAAIVEPTKLTATICDKKLTINGPVIANHLNMYRTAGSGVGADSGTPAEVFNLRPDAYMWASNFSGSQAKARTVYQTELPPRF